MTDSPFDALQLKGVARSQGLVAERRRLQGIFRARAKLDRDTYVNAVADEAEVVVTRNDLRPAYRAIKTLSGKGGASAPVAVKGLDGTPCSSIEEIRDRWREHFQDALNFPPGDLCPDLVELAQNTTPISV